MRKGLCLCVMFGLGKDKTFFFFFFWLLFPFLFFVFFSLLLMRSLLGPFSCVNILLTFYMTVIDGLLHIISSYLLLLLLSLYLLLSFLLGIFFFYIFSVNFRWFGCSSSSSIALFSNSFFKFLSFHQFSSSSSSSSLFFLFYYSLSQSVVLGPFPFK